MAAAVAGIRNERQGRDVYMIGAANAGKSVFLRAMVRCARMKKGGRSMRLRTAPW